MTTPMARTGLIMLAMALIAGAFWFARSRLQQDVGSSNIPQVEKQEQGKIASAPTKTQSLVPRPGSLPAPVASPLSGVPGRTYPVQNLGTEFQGLAEKANNGDMVAARTLAEAVRICADVPKTPEELDRATANATRPNLAPNFAAMLQHDLENKKSLFNQCAGVTADEIGTRARWIGVLAESGDAEARLAYVSVARPKDIMAADYAQQLEQYRKKAENYIQSEIDNGNPTGLLAMALQYDASSGRSSTNDVSLYAPDSIKAYAYYYAFGLAHPDDQSTVTILTALQKQLSQSQINQANQMGVGIYNKCCRH